MALQRVDRKNEIGKSVRTINQDSDTTGRQSLANAHRPRQSVGTYCHPTITDKEIVWLLPK